MRKGSPTQRFRRNVVAAILFTLNCALASCQPQVQQTPLPSLGEVTDKVDTGLVTNNPCAPPCWQGINLNDSKSETIAKLKSLPIVDTSTLFIGESEVSFAGGVLRFHEDRVESITYVLQYQLTLQNLINLKGEPDGFSYFTNVETATPVYFNLVWQDKGLRITVVSPIKVGDITKISPLKPEYLVNQATYFDPRTNSVKYSIDFKWQGYVPLPHY